MSQRTCTIDECSDAPKSKGLCSRHYWRMMRTRTAFDVNPNLRVCELPDCDLPHRARGFCDKHYQATRIRRRKAVGPTRDEYIRGRIVITPSDCWTWTMSLNVGYGRATFQGIAQSAHRFSYETYVGPIPDGLVIDHLCRNTACVNPDHLEPVTDAVNIARGESPSAASRRDEVCARQGHAMSGPNLYVSPRGKRVCRECNHQRYVERKARLTAA